MRRLYGDGHNVLIFLRYALIGGLSQVVDFGLFFLFIKFGMLIEVAGVISIALATVVHFTLNKYINFRNYDRATSKQLGTYVIIVSSGIALQGLLISLFAHTFHASAFFCKAAATLINFPYGYLAHRYLTFGRGIVGTYRHWRSRATRMNSPTDLDDIGDLAVTENA